ncbi:MAG: hypothetical protein KC656_33640, partial [Myxococcales bacterium]|nr:hypothetical protein [Myxococcales bacterium]
MRPALLAAGLLWSSAAWAQHRPDLGVILSLPVNEDGAGCPVPSEADCYDTAYLESACGELQYQNTWTCYGIWYGNAEAREDDAALAAVPRSASPSGIKKVIQTSTPKAATGRTFTPSPYRFTSQQAAHVT